MSLCFALLLDAGFLRYQLGKKDEPADAQDIEEFVAKVVALKELSGMRLHRTYFYDSKPLDGSDVNPLDGSIVDFGASETASHNRSLHAHVAKLPYVSMRFGELYQEGWGIKKNFFTRSKGKAGPLQLEAKHLKPIIRQKGVDMRIGLDIASLTLKKHVQVIVLATADSDFIPAMKFARREGAQLILVTLGKGVRDGMREHADVVIDAFDSA